MTVIRIVQGDITKLKCCCIVNAANKELNPGGGLDGIIRATAGPELDTHLREYRKNHPPLAPNTAVCTKGYNLKDTKYIIHCAAPDMRRKNTVVLPKKEDYTNLLKAYIATLRIGSDYQFDHMAFPLLGGGIYGYPIELTFLTGIQSILAFLELHPNYEDIEDDNEAERLPQEFSFVMVTPNAFDTCKKLFNGQEEYTFDDPGKLRSYLTGAYFKNGPKTFQDIELFGKRTSLCAFMGKSDNKAPYFKGPFSPDDDQHQPTVTVEKKTSFAQRLVKAINPFSVQGTSRDTAPSEERELDSPNNERTFERSVQQQSLRKRLQPDRPIQGTPPKKDKRQEGALVTSSTMCDVSDIPSTLSASAEKRRRESERKKEYRARKSAEKAQALLKTTSQIPSNSQVRSRSEEKRIQAAQRQKESRARKSAEKIQALRTPSQASSSSQVRSRSAEKRMKNAERQRECRARKTAEKAQGIGSAKKTPMTPDEARMRNNEVQRQRREQPIGRNLSFHDPTPDRVSNFPEPHYLGPMNVVCRYCNALHFKGKGGVCCNNGQIWLEHFFKELPQPLLRLLGDADRHFLQNIVSYNSLLAMASNVYSKEPVGKFGVQAEKVLGVVGHWVSALYPNNRSKPAFGNFYVFNAEEATEARMNSDVVKEWSAGIDKELLLSLTKCLEKNHPLAKSYRMMHEVLKREEQKGRDPGQMHMRIVDRYEAEDKGFDLTQHPGTYSVPVGNEYVCVFFTCRTDQKVIPRGLNVYRQLGTHKAVEIKNYMKVVDPLCYPLMFPHGEGLWEACRYPIQAEKRLFEEKMAEYNERMNTITDQESVNLDNAETRDETRQEMRIDTNENADSDLMDQFDAEEMRQMLNADNDRSVARPRITRVERNGEFYDVRNGEEEIPFMDGYMSDDSGAEVSDVEAEIENDGDVSEEAEEHGGDQMNDEEADYLNSLYDVLDKQDRMREARMTERDRGQIDDDMIDNDVYVPEEEEDAAENGDIIMEENNHDNQGNTATEPENAVEEMEQPSDDEERPQRKSRGFVSLRESIVFLNRYPKGKKNRVAQFRKLGQLHLIDAATRMAHQRMEHLQKHFTQTLQTTKKKLVNCLQNDMNRRNYKIRVGAVTTVPSHVPGSPRYMRQKFEEAVAMANRMGHPDLFITFTGSSDWKEFKENIPKGDSWADHPMMVAEIFKDKLTDFMAHVLGKKDRNGNNKRTPGCFGEVAWFVYSVEFQQRGMPHVHLILSLKNHIENTAQIDEIVSARIPDMPDVEDPNFEKKKLQRDLVLKYMVHRPCENDATAYCNQGRKSYWKKCSKRFPKEFTTETHFGDQAYPDYYRPDDGNKVFKKMSNGQPADCDNRYVVPHNPELLYIFQSHINVEVISSIRVVKYLFKYIFKGFDRTIVEAFERFGRNGCSKGTAGEMTQTGHILHPKRLNNHQIAERNRLAKDVLRKQGIPEIDPEFQTPTLVYDETAFIEDMRALTSCEAAWDVSANRRCVSSHTVNTLYVHAPDEEPIKFVPGEEEQVLDNIERNGITSRMKAWFELNAKPTPAGDKARTLTFDQMPSYFTYQRNKWSMRKNDWSNTLFGRIKSVQPRYMEQYAIRLLSMHQKGPRSFEELRTVNGHVHDSFVAAAKALRLMNDEMEWDMCLTEAASFNLPVSIRRLFISILLFCAPANPLELWEAHKEDMFANTTWTEEKKTAHALSHIRSGLQAHGMELSSFNLPDVIDTDLPTDGDYHNHDEQLHDDNSGYNVDMNKHAEEADIYYKNLNNEQLHVVKTIMEASKNDYTGNRLFFIEGAGGTGKTYVYKCLYHMLMAQGLKVLCVAHTGIAANLLMNGSTVHRAFGLPITMDDNLTSQLDVDSHTGHFLRSVDVIIWDEASMSDRRIYEAVDNYLRLITGKPMFMGGLLSVFGGDWRQTLPIVEDIPEAGIVSYTLKNTDMWRSMTKLKLTKNQRALNDPDFCKFLLSVGDGAVYEDKKKMIVRLPQEIVMSTEQQVIEWLYGGNQVDRYGEMAKKTLLTVDNRTALELNEKILTRMTGVVKTYMATDETDTSKGFTAMDPELYKSMTPSGMPPHELNLKKNCQVILLRNQNVKLGLCNGTRMRVTELNEDSITCEPINRGPYTPKEVILHRMNMTPARAPSKECAFVRHQFPIRLAFAMTINKSQGQTLDKVGVILRTPCFAHGQLYVALSRVREKDHIRVFSSGNLETRGLVKNKVNLHIFNQ